jgi:hypothetical protein
MHEKQKSTKLHAKRYTWRGIQFASIRYPRPNHLDILVNQGWLKKELEVTCPIYVIALVPFGKEAARAFHSVGKAGVACPG